MISNFAYSEIRRRSVAYNNNNNELYLSDYNSTALQRRLKQDNDSNLVIRVQHWYSNNGKKNNQNFWKDNNLRSFKIEFLLRDFIELDLLSFELRFLVIGHFCEILMISPLGM